ncbi:hypothetical protein C8Q77DRAFT_745151 [Trametes polyzona]|nr:hypothetical protein C8Q77DRAFT_745151 [Trametes polyzona]
MWWVPPILLTRAFRLSVRARTPPPQYSTIASQQHLTATFEIASFTACHAVLCGARRCDLPHPSFHGPAGVRISLYGPCRPQPQSIQDLPMTNVKLSPPHARSVKTLIKHNARGEGPSPAIIPDPIPNSARCRTPRMCLAPRSPLLPSLRGHDEPLPLSAARSDCPNFSKYPAERRATHPRRHGRAPTAPSNPLRRMP